MPVTALSLFGFMETPEAVNYLGVLSLLGDRSEPALREAWADARKRLGEPVSRAGQPTYCQSQWRTRHTLVSWPALHWLPRLRR